MSLVRQVYAARRVCPLLGFPRCQLHRTAAPPAEGESDLRGATTAAGA